MSFLMVLFQNSSRITTYYTVVWNIFYDNCSSCDYAMSSDFNTRHHLATKTEPCFCTNDNWSFTGHLLLGYCNMNILKAMISV